MTIGPYPSAARHDLVEEQHGRTVSDPYRWLEDATSQETAAWSAEQDALYARHRDQDAHRQLEEHFSTRLSELLGTGAIGAPVWRGPVWFESRREGAAEHPVVDLVAPSGERRTLLDPMVLDPTGGTTLDAWQPSLEGDLLAFQVSTGGTEESVLRVLDVATGTTVDGPLDRARYSPVAWLPAGRAFYYVRRLDPSLLPPDEVQYHRRVWLHELGSDPSSDVEVFGSGLDLTTYFGVQVTRDGRWLVVSASAGTAPRTDVWIADLHASSPQAPRFTEVIVGQDARTSAWVGRDGRLYLHTDLDARRGRLAVTDPTRPGVEHWTTLVDEDPVAVLDGVVLLDAGDPPVRFGPGGDGRPVSVGPVPPTELVALWKRHAVSEMTVHDPLGGQPLVGAGGRVPLPGLGTVTGLSRPPTGGRELWFGWTDPRTPGSVQRYDARTGTVEHWASPPGAPVDVRPLHVEQLSYPSSDGTLVRLLLLNRADRLDAEGRPLGPAPTILYGYGGFQISLEPAWSATAAAWVEAGGVYAVANLRGGGEEGEDWHRAGMRQNKQQVFDDFHAAAEHLVAQGWTTPDQLAVWGGSNGGLLVGAAVTQRPDLMAAAVCSAPLLDMVRYQHFGLGATWTDEYGDAERPEEHGWLYSYSPYHRAVSAAGPQPGTGRRFPAVLFTAFEGDTRVDPLHARKTCAALQHATSSDPSVAPVLLRRETGVGHGGRALTRTITLASEQLAFVARHTGLDVKAEAGAGTERR